MSFGERLAAARQKKKMTQTELGKGLGTDGADAGKQVIYGWEKNQHYPRVDQLMLICKKLDVSADFLLFGEESSSRFLMAEAAAEKLNADERAALIKRLAAEADEHDDGVFDESAVERSRSNNHNQPSSRRKKITGL